MAVVLTAAFAGAAVAAKLRQSMILGYLAVGVALGWLSSQYLQPSFGIQIVGNESVSALADLGVAFLLFFVGLEVSVSRLKAAGRPATVLAVADVAVLYFSGTLLGQALGWPLLDTLFLAGVLAMSSVGVAAKSLTDLKRLANDETAVLLGMMIVEDFITMIILAFTVAWALGASNPGTITESIEAVAIVYGILILLALFVIPRLIRKIERVRDDEIFALLALGVIFASAAFAAEYGMPFIVGTFFVGMAFAETRLSDRLTLRLSTLRDAFVGVFFLMFGVQIQITTAIESLWIVGAAVLIVLFDEVFILSALSVFIGFKGRAAALIGASAVGRGEDSIIFANIGAGLESPAGAVSGEAHLLSRHNDFYPIAGGVSLLTSAIVPVALKHTNALARAGSALFPHFLRHTTTVAGEFIHEAHLGHHRPGRTARSRWLFPGILAYLATVIASLLLVGPSHFALAALGAGLAGLLAYGFFLDALDRLPDTRVGRRHATAAAQRAIAGHLAFTVGALFFLAALIAAALTYDPLVALVAAVVVMVAIAAASARSIRFMTAQPPHAAARDLASRAREAQRARLRRKYREAALDETPSAEGLALKSTNSLRFVEEPDLDGRSRADGGPAADPRL